MKVMAQGMNSYEARVANTHLPESDLDRQTNVICEGSVFVKQASIRYGSEREHYRPYLQLNGEVHRIKGKFLNGVTEMTFPKEKGYPQVDYKYDFTNDELSDLDKKGLHDDGFRIPDIFLNNYFELPMVCNVCSVKGTNVPVMFVSVERPYNMEINNVVSGYDLASYFEQAKVNEVVPEHEEAVHFDETENMIVEDEPVHEIPKPVEPEIRRELTPTEQLIQNSLDNIENYTTKKVLERQQRLDAAKSAESSDYVVDEHDIMDEITRDSASAAVEKAGYESSVKFDSAFDSKSDDSDFFDDDDDFIGDNDNTESYIPDGSEDSEFISEFDSLSAESVSQPSEMTFGERVAAEMFEGGKSENNDSESEKLDEQSSETKIENEDFIHDDNEDSNTDDITEDNVNGEIQNSEDVLSSVFDESEDNKSNNSVKKRNSRLIAQGDLQEAAIRERNKRRSALTSHIQEIADESDRLDAEAAGSDGFDDSFK